MTGEPGIELLSGPDLHDRVITQGLLEADRTVWIATANLKDMHVAAGRGFAPILKVFDRMARSGVRFRVVHSDMPSRPFRDTLEGFPDLVGGALELQVCPRSHWKMVIVDGTLAYFGSANFTGAGLGARKAGRRNLELGAITRDPAIIEQLEHLFDTFWMGEFCVDCGYRERCPDPIR